MYNGSKSRHHVHSNGQYLTVSRGYSHKATRPIPVQLAPSCRATRVNNEVLTDLWASYMNKLYSDTDKALEGVLLDGMLIAAGGFGLCEIPELLISAIRDAGAKDLTIASNNRGVDDFGSACC